MNKYSIIIRYSEEDEAYIASVPELPGCMADGATYEEAAENARGIIDEWIETAKELKRAIPKPDMHKSHSGRILLRIPPWLHNSLEMEAKTQGVSLNQYILSLISFAHGAQTTANIAKTYNKKHLSELIYTGVTTFNFNQFKEKKLEDVKGIHPDNVGNTSNVELKLN